ncbi:MAG: two-component system histidine kinase PnpS [Bacillota bacterium]
MLNWSKYGIRNRLFIIFIVIQLLIIGLSFYYFTDNHRDFYFNQLKISLKNYADLILEEKGEIMLDTPPKELEEMVLKWGSHTGARITIVNKAGKVLADSRYDISKMDNHKNRPEISAVFSGVETAESIRKSDTLEEEMLYFSLPITSSGETVGVLRLARSLSFIRGVLIEDIKSYLVFFFILAVLTILLTWRLTFTLIYPLEKMTETAANIAEGDFSQRIPARRYSSEIEKLAEMFNFMTDKLEHKIDEISIEKNKMETILSSMVDGVIATDRKHRIVLINPKAKDIFNINKNNIKGKELIASIFSHRIDMYLEEALREKITITREIIYQNPNKVIMQATFSPIFEEDGSISGGIIVFTDITELRKLETVRNDFVANVSHELRTPLTSIIGYVDTLLDNDIDDPKIREKFLKIVKTEADRLSILIKDLLNLSKIEGSTPDLKAEDLKMIIEKTINLLADKAEKKDIVIEKDIEADLPPVYMVKEQIEQVMINLVDNAVKYTKNNGKIKISSYQKEDRVYVEVEDSGIGIPKDEQDRVFERFYRVDKARSRSLGGTGIGLSIVKNIIKQHGSEINLESREGKGSKFIFNLKIAK